MQKNACGSGFQRNLPPGGMSYALAPALRRRTGPSFPFILLTLGLLLATMACPAVAQGTSTPVPADPLQREPGASALKELRSHLDYQGPWLGMNRFDVLEGLRVLAEAGVVVVLSPGVKPQPVWIKSLRGYRKSNGWYGIRINGQEFDESSLYVQYGGREVNFQVLMSWGSRQTPGSAAFTREP
jgi:hypothetical protein